MAANIITLPQARIPIGSVMVDGVLLPVEISMEWMRALQMFLDRTGGTTSVSTPDLIQDISVAPPAAVAEPVPQFGNAPVYEPMPLPDLPDARIQSLEADVAALQTSVNDMAQGYQI